MLLRELTNQSLDEKQVWARTGKKLVRKYRCTGGRRTGRVVKTASQCFTPLNIKQSVRFKRVKQRLGSRMTRKSQKTKRTNSASIRLRNLNK